MDYKLKIAYETASGKKKSFSIKNIKQDMHDEDAKTVINYIKEQKLIGNDENVITKINSLSKIGMSVEEIAI